MKEPHPAFVALESLLADGVDLSRRNEEGDTPLHLAVRTALGEIVGDEPFVEEVDAPSPTSSMLASSLDTLLRRRFAPSMLEKAQTIHNSVGLMPIHIATRENDVHVCEALLNNGAPINAYTLRRSLHLHGPRCGLWVKRCKDGAINLLQNEKGETALHLSISRLVDRHMPSETWEAAEMALVRLLLKHGADVNATDYQRHTALHVAISGDLCEVAELLLAQSDMDLSEDGQNDTALHFATIRSNSRMVKLLVEHGAPVNNLGRNGVGNGWTPLCLAARSGDADVARSLIASGANIHAVSSNGKTALDIAIVNMKPGKTSRQSVYDAIRVEMLSAVLDIATAAVGDRV